MPIHIELYHLDELGDEEESVSISYCETRARLLVDGTTDPEDYDFYDRSNAGEADCLGCLQEFIRRHIDV